MFADLTSSPVDVQSRALVVVPGEAFEVTVHFDESLPKDPQWPPVLLGLRFEPVLGNNERKQLAGSSDLLWKPLKGDKARWSVKLPETGNYRATVFAQIPCSVHDGTSKAPELSNCFQRMLLKQKSEFRIRVSQIAAKLAISWDQPQTIEGLSVLENTPRGALQVSALALDGSVVLHTFAGIVQLAAVAIDSDGNFSLPLIGGQTAAPLVNGVASFPKLQFLQPGTYKLIATADGAQAAESAPLIITPPASRILRCVI